MINHLRTLLLNADGSENPGPLFSGEEYVPPSFRPRTLSPTLANVYRQLFGGSPDRAAKNYRLREYLTCVHASGLGGFATALDPRVTYWPFNNSVFEKAVAGPSARRLAGDADQALFFGGRARSASDRLYFRWQLDVADGSTVRVTQYDDVTGRVVTTTSSYSLADNLSGPVELSGSELTAKFTAGPGGSWLIEFTARPRRNLVDVAADLESGLGDAASALFGRSEPYVTFGNLWNLHDQLPFRLAGLVLALGYRINELPG